MADTELIAALREIEIICTESAGDCRRRMGTRVGNILTLTRKVLRADLERQSELRTEIRT